MDQADALLNLQSRRSTRQSKPTKHPDFLYTDADFLDEPICFRSISLRLQILQSKKHLAVSFSVPLSSLQPSHQTSRESVLRNRTNLTQACLTKQILSANCTIFNCTTIKQTC